MAPGAQGRTARGHGTLAVEGCIYSIDNMVQDQYKYGHEDNLGMLIWLSKKSRAGLLENWKTRELWLRVDGYDL